MRVMERYEKVMQTSKEHQELFKRVATRLQIVNPEEDKQHTASMSKQQSDVHDDVVDENSDNASVIIGGDQFDFSAFQEEYLNA